MEVGRVDLANWAFGLHRNSPQALNICSIRVFDRIRYPDIPITLGPLKNVYIYNIYIYIKQK